MKEVSVKMWELTLEEVKALPKDEDILVYNPLIQRPFMVRVKTLLENARADGLKNAVNNSFVYLAIKEPGGTLNESTSA